MPKDPAHERSASRVASHPQAFGPRTGIAKPLPDGQQLVAFSIDHTRGDRWTTSPAFSGLLGLADTETATTERFLSSIHPLDRASVAEAFDTGSRVATPGDFEGVLRILRPDSTSVSVNCHWYTLHDESGIPAQTVGALSDLSGVVSDSVVYAREFRLQSILEAAVDAIITIDRRGIIASVNRATEKLFGYTPSELIGQNVNILMPAPVREEHDGHISRYLATREPRIIGIGREVLAQRKDGSTFPADLAVGEMIELKMFTGIIRDISKRKEAEDSVSQEREFTQKILDTARAFIVVGDRQGNILRVNRHFEAISGFQQSDLVGRPCFEILSPGEQREGAQRQLEAALTGMCEQGAVHAMPTSSGLNRDVAWWHTPLTDESGAVVGLVCAGRDMTEYRQLHEKLVQSERLAALGEAMAGLAHESRNALQRSQVCLDLLSGRSSNDEQSLELLDSIQTSLDDLNRLYEEVRAFAAPIHLAPELNHIGRVVNRAWEDLSALRKNREVRFEEHISCDLYCDIDGFAIGRAFHNILENSLQACKDPVRIDVTYAEPIREDQPVLTISVRDNGPGIPPSVGAAVFDSFFTTKSQGTGLGLAIARRVVGAHSGSIELNPAYDHGAEIIVTLPKKQA